MYHMYPIRFQKEAKDKKGKLNCLKSSVKKGESIQSNAQLYEQKKQMEKNCHILKICLLMFYILTSEYARCHPSFL